MAIELTLVNQVAVLCCSVLQCCVAVCCSLVAKNGCRAYCREWLPFCVLARLYIFVLQCGALWRTVAHSALWCAVVLCVVMCCHVFQCVAVLCSVLQ